MTAVFIIITVSGTAALNLLFARKISEKTARVCMQIVNAAATILIAALFVIAGSANKHLKIFLEQQSARLELTVNKIYPGAFEKSFSTTEVKEMLKASLDTFESPDNGIETLAVNLVKVRFDKYLSLSLAAINALEQTEGTISLKDAILSLESLLLLRTGVCFKIIRRLLIVIYAVYFLGALSVSLYSAKRAREGNKSIVFGEAQ